MSLSQFARLRIGTRIYAGFAIILVLLAVLGALGVISFKGTETSFFGFAGISDNAIKVTEIDREFTGLRGDVLNYAATGNAQVLGRARENASELKKNIAAAAGVLAAERRARLEAIGKAVDGYLADFDTAVTSRVAREAQA